MQPIPNFSLAMFSWFSYRDLEANAKNIEDTQPFVQKTSERVASPVNKTVVGPSFGFVFPCERPKSQYDWIVYNSNFKAKKKYKVNQNLTKRIHLIWKKYWLLIFELRKIRFQNLWGPRTIEVNKITMNLIPGKILKMFSHDSFLWFIIILTSNNDKKFQRKWKFEWRMRSKHGEYTNPEFFGFK